MKQVQRKRRAAINTGKGREKEKGGTGYNTGAKESLANSNGRIVIHSSY